MADAGARPAESGSTGVQQLFPARIELDAGAIAEALDLPSRAVGDAELPWVVACWIASLDGRSTLRGRSSGLGNAADRAVFRGLRAQADGILVGSRTLAIERYRRPGRHPALGERRVALGLAAEPTVLVISRELALPTEVPLLQDPASKVRILTWSGAQLPPLPAQIDVTRLSSRDLRGALAAARVTGIRSIVCEGGPTLLGLLIAEDLLDELVITTAPLFVGAAELPVVAGPIAHPLRHFGLAALYTGEDYVFARYVRTRQRGKTVGRATARPLTRGSSAAARSARSPRPPGIGRPE